jgi:3-hydroxybutyryl-CoA dehydrogenase
MGAGIVEVFARSGLSVVAVDAGPEWVERGRGSLATSAARAVARGRLAEADRVALLERVVWTTEIGDLAAADLVVEAVPEVLELKLDLLASIDAVVRPAAVIATNTSSLSVTQLASATGHPERVVGMHFFNPAPVLRLVEVITTVHSDEAVVAAVRDLAVRLGKTPIVVGDRPGFVANALLFGYLGDAVRLLDSGAVTRDQLDAAIVASGLPLGPLALLDLIGLDVSAHILGVLHASSGDPRHAVPPSLAALVAEGRLGRKTGQGFWTYERPGSGTVTDAAPSVPSSDDAAVVDALVLPYVEDALRMVGEGYASGEDVDIAMREGCGFPRGPIEEARARGL